MEWWETYFSKYFKLTAFSLVQRTKSEIDFILRETNLQNNARILDMCCGAGRHTIEFAKKGYTIIGVDYSKELLENCKKHIDESFKANITLQNRDIRRYKTKTKFNLVVNLFQSIGYFDSERDNLESFKNICDAVDEKGILCLELHNFLNVHEPKKIVQRIPGGYKISEEQYFNDTEKRIIMNRVVEKKEIKDKFQIKIRIYTLDELNKIMLDNGLKYWKHYGDYNGNLFDSDSPGLIYFAKKNRC